MSISLSGCIIGHPTSRQVTYFNKGINRDSLIREQGLSNNNSNCNWTQQTSKLEGCKISRRLKCSEGSRINYRFWTRLSRRDQVKHIEHLTNTSAVVWRFPRDSPIPTTVKLGIDSGPPGIVQPALPTDTQGEQKLQHGIGVPLPLDGRLVSSGDLGSTPKKRSWIYHNGARARNFWWLGSPPWVSWKRCKDQYRTWYWRFRCKGIAADAQNEWIPRLS